MPRFFARRLPIILTACAWLLVGLALQRPAFAQGASEKAAAEALFDEGVGLLERGDYAVACQKLEDSQKVDPAIGTLLYLADCYEKSGRTASAWATFREASSLAQHAGQTERAAAGAERAAALEARLLRLTIELSPEASKIEGLEVRRGGAMVSGSLVGTALPVDPGQYVIEASAPGRLPYRVTVTVSAAAGAAKVAIPGLAVDPKPKAERAPPSTTAVASTTGRAPSNGKRTAGLVVGGLGIVGLGFGGVFGVLAVLSDGNARGPLGCGAATCPSDAGSAASSAALSQATISTTAFIAGGALLATGAVLVFTAPRSESRTLSLWVESVPGGARLRAGGRF